MPLDPETAKTRLKTFERPDRPTGIDITQFFQATLGLSEFAGLSTTATADLNSITRIGKAYRELGAIRRGLLTLAIKGKLGDAMKEAVQAVDRNPYSKGLYRQPFRAPGAPELLDEHRGTVLFAVYRATKSYDQPASFFAEWVAYIDPYGYQLHLDQILAGAIDAGDDEVFKILLQTIRGEHPVGTVCRSGVRALMGCRHPEAWAEVERLLLSAQREEGLRQTILESADELHPEAFKRFIRLVIEHNLLRFTSAARALAVWLPGLWREGDAKSGAKVLARLLEFLHERDLEPDLSDATDVYLRLWADAFEDVLFALQRADDYFSNPEPAVRRSVIRLASSTGLDRAVPLIKKALSDPDRTVVSLALTAFSHYRPESLAKKDIAPALWPVARDWPKGKHPDLLERPGVWDTLLSATPAEGTESLAEVVKELSPVGRLRLAKRLSQVVDLGKRRSMAIELFGDTSQDVRTAALESLESEPLKPEDARMIEDLLRRKATDLRHASLKLLRKQATDLALESGDRLIGSKDKQQRHAGLELLAEMADASPEARERIQAFAEARPTLDEVEQNLVAKIQPQSAGDKPVLENGFGLYTLDDLTFSSRPAGTNVPIITAAAINLLHSLDDLIEEHRNEEVTYPRWRLSQNDSSELETRMIGDLPQGFVSPRANLPYASDRARFPLADLVEDWLDRLLPEARDPDGQHLLRAGFLASIIIPRPGVNRDERAADLKKLLSKLQRPLRHVHVVSTSLLWMQKRCEPDLRMPVLLDMLAEHIATTASDDYALQSTRYSSRENSWRTSEVLEELYRLVVQFLHTSPNLFRQEDIARAFQLFRYIDEPRGRAGRDDVFRLRREALSAPRLRTVPQVEQTVPMKGIPRKPCPIRLLDRALVVSACTKEDVYDHLAFSTTGRRTSLADATLDPKNRSAKFSQVVQEYVIRIVEIEAVRGELPTDASHLVKDIQRGIHLPQVRLLLRANVALSARSGSLETSRVATFSHLFSVSRPSEGETPEVCAEAFKADGIKSDRLLELAVLAPQWAKAVELALGWKGFTDAVWWIHAHTKDEQWGIDKEIKEIWAGEISERTPLSGEQLVQGAVDVAWFGRFREEFDAKRWKQMEALAKFASQGSGHNRARLFAQAMQGDVSTEELATRIREKRTADAVRALGLVPLSDRPEEDIRSRYAVLQEFLAGSRQFGSMRQASEKLAVSIGMENLARTAGYPDPLRLTWALEAKEVEDLKDGGKAFTAGEVEVRLHFDELGEPLLSVSKNGAPLKDIPAAVKKLPEVKELVDRRTSLKKQTQRMRTALEQAMQRGDRFEAAELVGLMSHPGLAPLLRNLVFLGESGAAGFLDETGVLEGESGRLFIAHPYDLLERGDWPEWQNAVFRQERIQPFKQVFRELYTLTDAERESHTSTRYAGHQLNPRQTLAILGKRGWVVRADEGVTKTLHEIGLTARLRFEENFYSPADIEGLTLDSLSFTPSASWERTPLTEVPPKALSETMRDIDLIVSVASMVGVDPEASESTVEMRANVVREMALLMKLGNVSLTPRHAVVQGKLAEYSVHLGSGLVHQRARGELVILAVRQPQRGRLFLPFVDDDPKTAEIVSKVLLLARDDQMKDPSILSQIIRT